MKTNLSNYIHQIRIAMKDRRSKWIALISGSVYIIFYFIVTGLITSYPIAAPVELFISENWPALILRERAPFNWEPIGYLSLGQVQIFLSVPNIILGIIVGVLVGVNLAVSAFTYFTRGSCRVDPSKSILAAVPALLTGIACCGPSILLSIGIASGTVTVAFLSIFPFLFPLALAGLFASLLWSGRKLHLSYSQ